MKVMLKKYLYALTIIVFYVFNLTLSMAAQSILINGAGASFPYPIYAKWFYEYNKINPHVKINYQSIGSGGGIRQFLNNTVHFGASDSPMTDKQIQKYSHPILHIPTVASAVVLTYNLDSIKEPLKFSSEVITNIFLGKIKKWNDPQILKINPNINLPNLDIVVVHRADGSGTTMVFTDYLSKTNVSWAKNIGSGLSVNWPVGVGGKGNEGVTGIVKNTKGALGYVELIYALNNKLPVAKIQNKKGNFIEPTPKSVTEAIKSFSKNIPDDFRISITNADAENAYPISSFTYILISQIQQKPQGKILVKFLKWAITKGQKFADELQYSTLPQELITKIEKRLNTVKYQ